MTDRPGRPNESPKNRVEGALDFNELAPDRSPARLWPAIPSTNAPGDADVLGTLPGASGDLTLHADDHRTPPQSGSPGPM